MGASFGAYLPFVLAGFAILGLALAGYFYREAARVRDPRTIAEAEVRDVVSHVGKLVILPQDEEPIVATVSDPERLHAQPFFANAKVSDKVLIYARARRAILYRPSENKIVEVAPLNIGESPPLTIEAEPL